MPSVAAGIPTSTTRVASVDIVRGAVMVLMAIDHVRVYSGVPAGGPEPVIFLTRWITHFCAPAFVLLAGTAAFFNGRKLGDRAALSRYLAIRGILLVLLELTIVKLSWTFNPASLMDAPLAGVIWMLGWSMVAMAALVWLPLGAIGAFGLVVMLAQDVLRPLAALLPGSAGWIAQVLYLGGQVPLNDYAALTVLYSLVPWIGVMAAGYAFGALLLRPVDEQRRLCLRVGLAATAVFLIVGGGLVLANGDAGTPLWMQLLNQRKYPASQLYLLMTLGPTIALLPLADRARGALALVLQTFGRVPMFYYLLHIPLIHAVALLVWRLRDGAVNTAWFDAAPFVAVDPAQRWSVGLLYVVFVAVVAALYFPCRWLADLKQRGGPAWLRYI